MLHGCLNYFTTGKNEVNHFSFSLAPVRILQSNQQNRLCVFSYRTKIIVIPMYLLLHHCMVISLISVGVECYIFIEFVREDQRKEEDEVFIPLKLISRHREPFLLLLLSVLEHQPSASWVRTCVLIYLAHTYIPPKNPCLHKYIF